MIISFVLFISALNFLEAQQDSSHKTISNDLNFSSALFKHILSTPPTENVVFSPTSVYRVLLLLSYSASGSTLKQLESVLHGGVSWGNSAYLDEILHGGIATVPGVQFELEFYERIFHSSDIKIKKDMEQHLSGKVAVFKTEDQRAKEMNSWISKETKGLIQDLVKQEMISKTLLTMINACYFKAEWVFPLIGGTHALPFTLNDGATVRAQLMKPVKDQDIFKSMVDQSLQAQVISLPYKTKPGSFESDVSMIIIMPTTLPKKGSAPPLQELVKKLSHAAINDLLVKIHKQTPCGTDLLLPKFEINSSFDLKPILSSMGLSDLLHNDLNLSNLVESGPLLTIESVAHGARVNVHENGTVAAAATVINANKAAPCFSKVYIDSPFIYLIHDSKKERLLFAGVVANPKK